jgi:hypothetical protein
MCTIFNTCLQLALKSLFKWINVAFHCSPVLWIQSYYLDNLAQLYYNNLDFNISQLISGKG